jgi:hypothetical protein
MFGPFDSSLGANVGSHPSLLRAVHNGLAKVEKV